MPVPIPTIRIALVTASALALACTVGPKTNPDDTGEPPATSSSGDVTGDAPTTGMHTQPPPSTSMEATSAAPTSDEPPGTSEGPVDDTSDFIVEHDLGPTPDGCDLAAQACPEGQKCNPSAAGGASSIFSGIPVCVPLVPGAKPPGSPCSVLGDWLDGTDDCELGSVCLFPDDQGIGECHALCNIESGELPPDPSCAPGNSCVATGCQECFWSYCDAPCDPRDPGTCDAAEVCIESIDHWFCSIDASGDEGQDGDPCEFVNACDPGLSCVPREILPDCDNDASGCCSPLCSTDKPNTCPGKDQGETCQSWYGEGQGPPELATLGVCTLPP